MIVNVNTLIGTVGAATEIGQTNSGTHHTERLVRVTRTDDNNVTHVQNTYVEAYGDVADAFHTVPQGSVVLVQGYIEKDAAVWQNKKGEKVAVLRVTGNSIFELDPKYVAQSTLKVLVAGNAGGDAIGTVDTTGTMRSRFSLAHSFFAKGKNLGTMWMTVFGGNANAVDRMNDKVVKGSFTIVTGSMTCQMNTNPKNGEESAQVAINAFQVYVPNANSGSGSDRRVVRTIDDETGEVEYESSGDSATLSDAAQQAAQMAALKNAANAASGGKLPF